MVLSFYHSASAQRTQFPALGASQPGPQRTLTVYSSIDLNLAKPLVNAFQRRNPGLAIVYHDMQTLDIYERVIEETDRGEGVAQTGDLVISSAMDLQLKLVNDGYATTLPRGLGAVLPDWAVWRNEAFGVTYEPAVIIYHKPSFAGRQPPRSRAQLIAELKNADNKMFGRIATYDIERSGLGFLFFARDQENFRDIWQLVAAMGASGVKLYSSSAAILERVADGRFSLGYNILGTYAKAWARTAPDLGIILPEDYTVVMSRIAMVPRAARNPALGTRFLRFLLSREGQTVLANQSQLNALNPAVSGPNTTSALRAELGARLRPIRLGPGLLVYLDQVKRARLIKRWNRALGGGETGN
ncbi:MAG: ABC transporter substrate-binding protein [Alphaproteobacteria bacterium]